MMIGDMDSSSPGSFGSTRGGYLQGTWTVGSGSSSVTSDRRAKYNVRPLMTGLMEQRALHSSGMMKPNTNSSAIDIPATPTSPEEEVLSMLRELRPVSFK